MNLWHRKAPLALLAAIPLFGCSDKPISVDGDDDHPICCTPPRPQASVDKIDLVLGIDNSRSMADKQQILAKAIPDLVKGLVNPRCLDDAGVPAQMQPSYPTAHWRRA